MTNNLVIRYGGEGSKIVLKLDQFFPRSKKWLTDFEKLVLRYCPERDDALDALIAYLKEVKIPGLPKELEALDGQIEQAHIKTLSFRPKSIARESAAWEERQLKSRRAHWFKYCDSIKMNLEMLEAMRGCAW